MSRIGYIDGLRALSIFYVIAYHFFARFIGEEVTPYLYGDMFEGVPLLSLGIFGVYLFFGVSGFVIVMTLSRSASLLQFAIRRFARLWPTMLLCASLTFGVLSLWPNFWTAHWGNFLPSLSLISPKLWNAALPGVEVNWMDKAYWSLFVEVRFYAIAGCLYFLSRKHFILLINLFFLGSLVIMSGAQMLGIQSIYNGLAVVTISNFSGWFLLGIAAYLVNQQQLRMAGLTLFNGFICLGWASHLFGDAYFLAFAPAFAALLILPQWWDGLNRALSIAPLAKVGLASYSLYLVHQYAGLTISYVIADAFALTGWAAVGVALGVIAGCIGLSMIIDRYWEEPLNKALVKGLTGKLKSSSKPSSIQSQMA
jgi:peptidoglycan/LPS O-acetylase OafA/YrhL